MGLGTKKRMSKGQSSAYFPGRRLHPSPARLLQKSIASDRDLEESVAGPKQIDHSV